MGEFAQEVRWESKEGMNLAFIHHAGMCGVHVRLGKESWREREKEGAGNGCSLGSTG